MQKFLSPFTFSCELQTLQNKKVGYRVEAHQISADLIHTFSHNCKFKNTTSRRTPCMYSAQCQDVEILGKKYASSCWMRITWTATASPRRGCFMTRWRTSLAKARRRRNSRKGKKVSRALKRQRGKQCRYEQFGKSKEEQEQGKSPPWETQC